MSLSYEVSSIISGLSSQKLKERKESLENLNSVLKTSPDQITVKAFSPIIDALVNTIELEKVKYDKLQTQANNDSRLDLQEDRLNSTAYALRLFIEKCCNRFKPKHVKLLSFMLFELMTRHGSLSIVPSVAEHLTYALLTLSSSPVFEHNFDLQHWISLINNICESMACYLDITLNDKIITNFLNILLSLMGLDTIGMEEIGGSIIRMLNKYLSLVTKENSNTKIVMGLINMTVLKLHLLYFQETLYLIYKTMNHLLNVKVCNDSVLKEISRFNLMTSELLHNNVPLMVGADKSHLFVCKTDIFRALQSYLEHSLQQMDTLKLTFDGLGTTDAVNYSEFDWYNFPNIQIIDDVETEDPWHFILSMTILLDVNYKFVENQENALTGGSLLFKRRKVKDSFSHMLKDSMTYNDFLCNCLESSYNKIKISGLQLTLFYLSIFDCNKNDILQLKDSLMSCTKDPDLMVWCLKSFTTLCAQKEIVFTTDELMRLFKLVIPLLKIKEKCKIACALFYNLIENHDIVFEDKNILQHFQDLFLLSDVNGPAILCNEAFKFWMNLYGYVQHLQMGKSAIKSIYGWLYSKWDQLYTIESSAIQIDIFASWLTSKKHVSFRRLADNKGSAFHRNWMQLAHERKHLLSYSIKPRTKILTNESYAIVLTDEPERIRFLYKLFELLDDHVNPYSFLVRSTVVIRVIETFVGDKSYRDYVVRFNELFTIFESSIDYKDNHTLLSIIQNAKVIKNSLLGYTFLEALPTENILTILKQKITNELDFNADLDDFASSSPKPILSSESFVNNFEMVLEFMLDICSLSDSSLEPLQIFIELFKDLPPALLLEALQIFINSINRLEVNFSENAVEQFTQFLGSTLLVPGYDTSSVCMTVLIEYLSLISKYWIMKNREDVIAGDCNDIFDWIIEKYEDVSFCSCHSFFTLSRFMIHLLENFNLSQSSISGGKQRVFQILSGCINRLPKYLINRLVPELKNYANKVGVTNQRILFKEVIQRFSSHQITVESTSFYSLTCVQLSNINEYFLTNVILHLLESPNIEYVTHYVKKSITLISSHRQLNNGKELFHQCRFSIISQWFDESAKSRVYEPTIWKVDLFGFEFDDFCIKYQLELTAFFFAKSSTYYFIIDHLKTLLNVKQEKLLNQAIAPTIALSYIDNGVKDLIFDILEDVLGKRLVKIFSNIPEDFVYYLIKFTDLSNLSTVILVWKKIFIHSTFKNLLESNTLGYTQIKNNVTVPFATIYKVAKGKGLFDMIDESKFAYLIQRLLRDLSECKLVDQKINTIRQIALLVLVFENLLSSFKDFDFLLLEIANLLNDGHFLEVQSLIMDLLDCAMRLDISIERSFFQLFRFCIQNTENTDVTTTLLPIMNPKLFNSKYLNHRSLWVTCYELLIQKRGSFCFNDIKTVLTLDIMNDRTIFLLSDLFDNFEYNNSSPVEEEISQNVISNLIHILDHGLGICNSVKKWAGKLLGEVFCERSYEELVTSKNSSIHLEFDLPIMLKTLWSYHKNSDNIKVRFLLDNILYIVLTDRNVISELKSEEYPDISAFTPITVSNFEECHGAISCMIDEQLLHEIFLDKYCEYSKWIGGILSHILSLVIDNYPSFRVLLSLIGVADDLCETLLECLVKLLLARSPKQRSVFLASIFNKIGLLKDTKDYKPKTKILVHMFLLIRGMAFNDIHEAAFLYKKIDFNSLIPILLDLEMNHFALMLYEEYQGTIHDNTPKIEELYEIYSPIKENDMFYGLPLTTSLSSSLNLIMKTKFDSFNNFALNSGQFEEAVRNGRMSSLPDFASVASSNGFTGLAMMLDNNIEHSTFTEEQYNWSLKLNRWDLPIPDKLDSLAKTSFAIIKGYSNNSVVDLDEHLLRVVNSSSLITDNQTNLDILECLRSISMLKKIESIDGDVLLKLSKLHENELMNADYVPSTCQDIQYWTRHHFLMLKTKNYDDGENNASPTQTFKLATVLNLVHMCEYLRSEGRQQDIINSAILLENVVLKLTDLPNREVNDIYTLSCKRASTVESARMLWKTNESAIAIKMLESLLQDKITVKSISAKLPDGLRYIILPDIVIDSQLVAWYSHSKHRSSDTIYKDHILRYESELSEISDHDMKSSICYSYAEFCYKQCQRVKEDELLNLKDKIEKSCQEQSELSKIFKNTKLREIERKEAKRHYNRITLQIQHDKDRYNKIVNSRSSFVSHALHFFLTVLVYSNAKDDEVMDKFCSLWFSFSHDNIINSKLQKEIGTIPSYKFLPWVNQMASKLTNLGSPFQDTLQLTLKRMLYKLPYETLYPLLSMSFQDSESSVIDPITKARVDIANRIVTALDMYDNGKYGSEFTVPIKDFCSMSVGLASYKLPPKTKFIQLENLNIGNYWLKDLPKAHLPLPTVPFPISCSQDGRRKDRPYITSIDPVVQISSSGLSLPKIATFTLSDGSKHRVLLKGSNDDLRQDAIMEQVFKQVNKILNANTETRKQKLRIRTYEVIPLGPRAGIIEFVANSIPLHNILLDLHLNDELSFDKARKIMKAVQNQSIEERVAAYERITEKIKPQFRNFFFQSFVEPHEWYDKRLSYTKGVVTTSIVGYLLGLGDRHLNNILIDKKTGEPIHIDLGVAFDQGKLLPIPELVPFRLTRDIVNGFGVTGVEGVFRKNCERVFKVLQDEKERVMCVLNVLKWDPLYSWKMTPLKKRKLQAKIAVDYDDDEDVEDVGENDDNNNGINASRINGFSNEENNNDESIRALNGVENKLYGEGLSVEAIVQELLASATDTQSLATIYMGWSPFY